ncbi:MAG: DUF3048 domain-containing protein [Candidatus Pacebacteria bacterium]|nr:DUF3048 domain-containing protein [Candidatus Paceibacterota bacterium]
MNIKKILFYRFSRKQTQILGGFGIILVFISFAFFVYFKQGKDFSSIGKETKLVVEEVREKNISPFSGISCENNKKRAVGVILAQYPETMPLSGISEADIVIEWPVANAGGVTRLLAIFQCKSPKEVGSIRSVRPYMADIALGFDVVLASWGGSRSAFERIEKIGLDWLNAMVNPSGAFFRKYGRYAPHNGFSTIHKLRLAMRDKKMRRRNRFSGYEFWQRKVKNRKTKQSIKINYNYTVEYVYDYKTGNYLRSWRGQKAIDANTGKQAYAKNVVLMKTKIGVLSPGVADAKVIGSGSAKIYKSGKVVDGKWRKRSSSGKLSFYDKNGKDIKFIPGPIWIEITHKF